MKYFKKIDGDRIYLSPVSVLDAEVYTAWMNDVVIAKNTDNIDRVMTLDQERNWLLNPNPYAMAIVSKKNDELLGNVGFAKVDSRNRTAVLGIFIGEEKNRNQGYGSEAIKLLMEYGFQNLNLHSILLTVLSFNENAIHCYEKIGFKMVGREKEVSYCDGAYHDRITMQILEEEWRDKYE